jgi:hypothetical protein
MGTGGTCDKYIGDVGKKNYEENMWQYRNR